MQLKNSTLQWVLIGTFAVLAVSLGFRPLRDPDLGWHIAGGLWMMAHRAVPMIDPFGALGSPWINYSWLFQLPAAFCYSHWGFRGLQFLQAGLIFLLLVLLFEYAQHTARRVVNAPDVVRCMTAGLVVLIVVLLAGPSWSLRPQLLSLSALVILLLLLRQSKQRSWTLFGLTILWSNFHVYWLLVPGLFVISRFCSGIGFELRTIAFALCLFVAGIVSPYGINNLWAVYEYAFQHQMAYQLIEEFGPVSIEDGFVFWCLWGVLISALCFVRPLLKKCGPADIAVFFLFGGLAVMRAKYVALFGVVAIPVFVAAVAESLAAFAGGAKFTAQLSGGKCIVIGAMMGVLLLIALTSIDRATALDPVRVEALNIAERVVAEPRFASQAKVVVMNDFNDGGWLILGFYLATENSLPQDRFKVAIDGRTLVAGGQRLSEYDELRKLAPGWENVVRKWAPDVVVVRDTDTREKFAALLNVPAFN